MYAGLCAGIKSRACGVAQGEEPLAPMGSTDFRRAEEACRNRVTVSFQVSRDSFETVPEVVRHVLKEDLTGTAFEDDTQDLGPEMPLVLDSTLPSSGGEGLARVARSDEIHDAMPGPTVEGGGIRPHRRFSQSSFFHRRYQTSGSIGFPLHHADDASVWHCQLDAEIETAPARA
jgi:hypothetical protein